METAVSLAGFICHHVPGDLDNLRQYLLPLTGQLAAPAEDSVTDVTCCD